MLESIKDVPQEEIEHSMRSAVRQIYKLGYPQYLKLEYDDVWQDAHEVLLKSSGRAPRNSREVYCKVLRRLIDKYRSATGVRRFKRNGETLPKVVLTADIGAADSGRIAAFDRYAVANWQDAEAERFYEVECDERKFRLSDVDLERNIRRTLDESSRETRTAAACVYFKNQTMKQAGKILGVSESRVSQLLKKFRASLKRSLVPEC